MVFCSCLFDCHHRPRNLPNYFKEIRRLWSSNSGQMLSARSSSRKRGQLGDQVTNQVFGRHVFDYLASQKKVWELNLRSDGFERWSYNSDSFVGDFGAWCCHRRAPNAFDGKKGQVLILTGSRVRLHRQKHEENRIRLLYCFLISRLIFGICCQTTRKEKCQSNVFLYIQ